MYHQININKLSHNQISKLLNGHRIRVKHGHGHTIHASTEQHNKISKAHRKGAGHTIQFDPYQIEHHQHLRGHGGGSVGSVVNHLAKSTIKHYAPKVIDYAANYAKNKISGLGMEHPQHLHHAYHPHYIHGEALNGGALMPAGYGVKRGRPRKGHGIASELATHAFKTVAPILINEGAHYLHKKISGRGGRPQKRGRPKGKGIKEVGRTILGGIKKYGPTVAREAIKYAPLALSML